METRNPVFALTKERRMTSKNHQLVSSRKMPEKHFFIWCTFPMLQVSSANFVRNERSVLLFLLFFSLSPSLTLSPAVSCQVFKVPRSITVNTPLNVIEASIHQLLHAPGPCNEENAIQVFRDKHLACFYEAHFLLPSHSHPSFLKIVWPSDEIWAKTSPGFWWALWREQRRLHCLRQ